jgi:hypothetical protein
MTLKLSIFFSSMSEKIGGSLDIRGRHKGACGKGKEFLCQNDVGSFGCE